MHLFGVFALISLFCSFSEICQVAASEDDEFYIEEPDMYDWSKHPCHRKCRDNEEPKECRYIFVVEMYTTMSKACYDCPTNTTDCHRPHCIAANGIIKTIYTVNRQMPGTTIEVCKNDRIIVDVRNEMVSEGTAIHWHGIMQRGSPYMDGVPFVTQCPIHPGNSFRYNFNASQTGTYFWHSHVGSQRDDGLFGALIIHSPPKENPHDELYDYDDHVMTVSVWGISEASAGTVKADHAGKGLESTTILVNGRGRHLHEPDTNLKNVPFSVFEVEKNFRYRFRLIASGGNDCPVEVSIDNHTMSVISMDGNDIEPVEVDTFLVWNGERVDFVINANREINNYWIRYRGYGTCSVRKRDIHQLAILRYKSAPLEEPQSPTGYNLPEISSNTRVFNPFNAGTEDSKAVTMPTLKAMAEDDESMTREPDSQFYITYDFYEINSHAFNRKNLYGVEQATNNFFVRQSLLLNHISFKLPSFPLLSQPDMIDENTFCNSTTLRGKNCEEDVCSCTHTLQVQLNSVVEVILIDEGITMRKRGVFNHPLHLHGHFFRVVAMEALEGEQVSVELVKKLDREGKIKRNLYRAPLKDTVKVPSNGYTIIRFHATNPGYWLYHCHVELHMSQGMALLYRVGEHEDLPPPPAHFPTCGNFYN